MRSRFALTTVLALVAGLFTVFTPTAAHAADKDCSDFAIQKAAQIFFLEHGGPSSDPHNLDGSDDDGIACESNPCTCYYKKSLPDGDSGTTVKVLRQKARVIQVIDGDTVDVNLGGKKSRVRMIGIDTPEVYGGVECGGRKASTSLKGLLPRRTRVVLVSDLTQDRRDRYGRLLRYVMKAGKDVNRIQVGRGWARVYVYNDNPFKRVAAYRKSQRNAKSHDRGIWGLCR